MGGCITEMNALQQARRFVYHRRTHCAGLRGGMAYECGLLAISTGVGLVVSWKCLVNDPGSFTKSCWGRRQSVFLR